MSDKNEHAALDRILRIAKEALSETQAGEPEHSTNAARAVCTPKSLPKSLLVQAVRKAAEINPMNSPIMQFALGAMPADPLSIAALTTKYWGPNRRRLTVKFMDTNSKALKDKILQYMNAWSKTACITFVETSGTAQVRHIPRCRRLLVISGNRHSPDSRQSAHDESRRLHRQHIR